MTTERRAITSPTDIEIALEAYVVPRIAELSATARQHNLRYVFANPALSVGIFEGRIEILGPTKFRVHCTVHVETRFSSAKSEEDRRDKINPLVFALIRLLGRQKLGLQMTGLIPKGFKDVSTEDDFKNNLIVYDIEFATAFTLVIDEESADDFLGLAMEFFLKTGDPAAAANDVPLEEL